jgi:nitrate reductase alpha subunit
MITPTIQCCCDVFLPISTVLEHDGVNRTHYGAASITTGCGNKAINVGETKCDLEIYTLLAKKMAEMSPMTRRRASRTTSTRTTTTT